MKKMKNLLAIVAMMLLVAMISVAGTIAWLTSSTTTVTNTFSIGEVEITLDEVPVDLYGEVVEGARRTENDYKLLPGHNYTKDPTVHVVSGSEPCYVYVKVENAIAAIEANPTIAEQMAEKGWTALTVTDENGDVVTVANVYYYKGDKADSKGVVDARNAAIDLIVFEEFTLADNADVSAYDEKTVTIDAFAVQADGFTDAADAWRAFESWGN